MDRESRVVERNKLFYFIEILELGTDRPIGRVGDISLHGLMIQTNKPFQLNRIIRIELRVPSVDPFNGGFLPLEVEPRWIKKGENLNKNCVGCSIISYPSEARETIIKLIEFYGKKESTAS